MPEELHPTQWIGDRTIDYINNKRISKAVFLLLNTERKIIDIAYTVGYRNLNFFNKKFREITGNTPGEYRKSRGSM